MATYKLGNFFFHASNRGLAFKWGENGTTHRLPFRNFQKSANQADNSYARNGNVDDYGDYYDDNGDSGQNEPSFLYDSNWLVWLLLIVLPPLGIWVLWKRNRFDTAIQAGISAVSAIWFVVLLFWLFSSIMNRPQTDNVRNTSGNTTTITTTTPTSTPAATIAAGAPTAPVEITEPDGDDTSLTGNPSIPGNTTAAGATANPIATPRPNVGESLETNTAADESTYVYMSSSGLYYHGATTCGGVTYQRRVSVKYAKEQGRTACPVCLEGSASSAIIPDSTTYYATANGDHYHSIATCSGMKGATSITKEAAEQKGQTPCPECLGSYYMTDGGDHYHIDSACSGMKGAKKVTKSQALAAKKTACPVCIKKTSSSNSNAFYSTSTGKYYHSDASCSGMKGATRITQSTAISRKQTACPICIGGTGLSSTAKYYATNSGEYYHIKSDCSGMKNASAISLATAKKEGKKACPVCLASASSSGSRTSDSYYATKEGAYYHTKIDCSGMKGASKISLETAAKYNKKACPVCVKSSSSSTYVYMTSGGEYYHAKNDCSGMSGATKATLATAKSAGKKACPICVLRTAKVTPAPTVAPNVKITSGDKTAYCYATQSGAYYHKTSTCSGMTGADRITIAFAKEHGKTPCPICAANASSGEKVYYGVQGNKYFHTKKNCSGMVGASAITLSTARSKNLSACPICVLDEAADRRVVTTYCYISPSNSYYHTKRGCSDMASPSKVTLSQAKSAGRTACPMCAGDSLDTMVYVRENGSTYHTKGICDGVVMDLKASISAAINKGYRPCSKCNAPRPSTHPAYTPRPDEPEVTPVPGDYEP